MTEDFWLINSNRSRVKRFSKNNQNKDKFFEYIFINFGRILGVLEKEPPLMTTREKLRFKKEFLSKADIDSTWHGKKIK